MSITVSFTDKAGYLLVKSVGSVASAEDIVDHAKAIFAETPKHTHKKLLIDVREVSRPNKPLVYYEAVQRIITDLPVSIRSFIIAIVLSTEYDELGKFFETTAINRGLQCYVFLSEQEAQDWLERI